MYSTKDIVRRHLTNFSDGNINGILSDYVPDAVLFTANGALKGIAAIRPLFEGLVAEFGKPGASFNLQHEYFDGDFAYILWTAETAENVYELATDTFVIKEGKIVAQSFTGKIRPRKDLTSSPAMSAAVR